MDDHSPHTFGLSHSHEFKPTVNNTVPRAKRPLDSPREAQVLQAAKKACVLSHHCSIPCPSEKLLLCSPDSACFQGSSHFLDSAGHDEVVASCSESKYNDVATSLDTARCFDDSEPDDSLLELSDSEQGNSPFNYTEEEIQEILADDCLGSEQCTTRKSTVSQNVNGESEKDVSSSCTGASVISEDVKLNDTAVGQIGQKETTSGKKLGKVIPVPQVEERLKQGAYLSEVELEQEKHLYPVCSCPCEEICRSYTRDLSSGELQPYIPQRCVSQPCLTPTHPGPFWQEQVRASSTQQGGVSSEDYP
ncbi:uncharacterized protein LOC112982051 isoform X1 [Dromaius novaehollandiae]|nr:uncharacterized protein LOC112982051 isoform X1 [Dromaius novaehollandiae]XP_025953917.1 uncharacterized protein LOC112982051 isoform X1 [Dromaius novaehollandiae]